MKTTRILGALCASLMTLSAGTASATPDGDAARADIAKSLGFVPGFLNALPEQALPFAWEKMKTLQLNPKTALSGKAKELIGLAVSAQIPCTYCIYAHTRFAALNGATPAEISEAVTVGALTRFWSTWFNGLQPDEAKFRAEVAEVVALFKKGPPATPPKMIALTDAKAAREDIMQRFGRIPGFLDAMPDVMLPAAWRSMRDTEFSETALDAKTKSLASIAVASQIPCRYCVIADVEFARLGGASEAEIREAILMSALTRELSTFLNGTQVELAAFKRDVDKLVANVKRMAQKAAGGH